MISHKEWLRKYKNCPAKVYANGITISQYTRNLTPSGHFMCGAWFPFGKRCMYKICQEVKKENTNGH